MRRTLLDMVLRRPGTRLKELHGPLGQPRMLIHYHLDILERVGALTRRVEGGATRYYPAQMGAREIRERNLLLRGRVLEFVCEVAEHPGIGQDELVRTRRISRKVLREYVPRLVEQGLLHIEPGAKTKYYHPTDSLRRALRRLDEPFPSKQREGPF